MNREQLIKKAAEAMVEYDNPGAYERGDVIANWDDYVGAARAAFAVFEEAHTPTEHPVHSGHEYGGGYARAAALAGGDPDWMNATGGTPTDDEREALIALGLASHRGLMSDGHVSVVTRTNEEAADVALAAGFRRTVQGEPSLRDHVRALTGETDAGLSELGGFQGEPTDSQADAAQKAFHEFTFGPDDDFLTPRRMGITRQAWKVALRAAFNETGENRG